jgi:hypothetical protein
MNSTRQPLQETYQRRTIWLRDRFSPANPAPAQVLYQVVDFKQIGAAVAAYAMYRLYQEWSQAVLIATMSRGAVI